MPLGHIDPPNSSEHAILIFSEDYSMTTTIYAHKHVNQDGTAPESGQYVVGDPNHAPTVIVYEGTASGPTVATIVYKGRLRGFRAGLIHFSGKPPILFKRWMTRAGSRGGEHRLNIAGEDYVWTGARKNVLQLLKGGDVIATFTPAGASYDASNMPKDVTERTITRAHLEFSQAELPPKQVLDEIVVSLLLVQRFNDHTKRGYFIARFFCA